MKSKETTMKSLVVFVCLLVVAYGITPEAIEYIKTKIHTFGAECRTEIGVPASEVSPLLAHKLPTSEKAKCFVACMHKKMGFQDNSGKIDKEGAYAGIEAFKSLDAELYEKLKKVADICLVQVKNDPNECETAANMLACIHNQKEVIDLSI